MVLSLRRPARWAPAEVATHFSAIQPTYGSAVAAASTAAKYCNGLPNSHRHMATDGAPHAQTTVDDGTASSLHAGG